MSGQRPITMLIAALGGEGGGVLTGWIVDAAAQAGFPVQSTSIPGVAQRTGATTYYIEILPVPAKELGGKRPVLALTPGVGDIDLAVTSELLEAGRTVANGFVTPDRTCVIASSSRFYAMDEKITMGDGRFDQDKLTKAIKEHAREALLLDMARLAQDAGAMINAVMLGAIAGSGKLPLAPEQLEAAIRADGKQVDANLRGFRAGLDVARAKVQPAKIPDKKKTAAATRQSLEQAVAWTFPALAQATALEGTGFPGAMRVWITRPSNGLSRAKRSGPDGWTRQVSSRTAEIMPSTRGTGGSAGWPAPDGSLTGPMPS